NGTSLPFLIDAAEKGDFDMVVHVGDIAYDLHTYNGERGDLYMQNLEPLASRVPYMVVAGNHEDDGKNFSHYQNRFTMPGYDNQFYSFEIGPVHFVTISTEYYGYFYKYSQEPVLHQYNWLQEDLKKADGNREKIPWIIGFQHRPFYCSNENTIECKAFENTLIRTGYEEMPGLEPILNQYGVDLEFWGHEHSYERFLPVNDRTVYNNSGNPYHNAPAPTYIISGSAGCYTPKTGFRNPIPASAFRSVDFGYSLMTVYNHTHINVQQISVEKGGVIDEIWLVKDLGHRMTSKDLTGISFPPAQLGIKCSFRDTTCRREAESRYNESESEVTEKDNDIWEDDTFGKLFHVVTELQNYGKTHCDFVLGDHKNHELLKEEKFDITILQASGDTEKMSFLQRTENFIETLLEYYTMNRLIIEGPQEALDEAFLKVNINKKVKDAAFLFVNSDELVDFTSPITPKTIYIGALGRITQSKLLEQKYLDIFNSAKRGVIYFSFGTVVLSKDMPPHLKNTFLDAFSEFPDINFIWKYENESHNIAESYNNVFTFPFLPQNDLLDHTKLLAFITHGGMNSITEAAIKGVPMIAIPIFGDQNHNARILEAKRTGITLLKCQITKDLLISTIRKIIDDESYMKNAKQLSRMVMAKPMTAEERVVKYTEFAAEFGDTEALQSEGRNLHWIQLHSIDVIFFLLVIVLLLFSLFYKVIRLIIRKVKKLPILVAYSKKSD
ncbi:hypothetical protein FO519_005137, partial [Halicephalobus sp. NKZ332]